MIKKNSHRGRSPLLQFIFCLALVMSAAEVYASDDPVTGLTPFLPVSIPAMEFTPDTNIFRIDMSFSFGTPNVNETDFGTFGGLATFTSAFNDTVAYSLSAGIEIQYFSNSEWDSDYEMEGDYTVIPFGASIAFRFMGSSADSSGIIFMGINLAKVSSTSLDYYYYDPETYHETDYTAELSSGFAYGFNVGIKGRQLLAQFLSIDPYLGIKYTGINTEITSSYTETEITYPYSNIVTENNYSMESVVAVFIGAEMQMFGMTFGMMVELYNSLGGHEIEFNCGYIF